MRVPFVDLKAQYLSIKDEIDAAMQEVVENTAFVGGKTVTGFERAFAEFSGAKYCVGTSSGTSALHIALQVCGVGPGDEVITVPNTFIASTEAISQSGATFKLVDIDPETFNMDPNALEGAITSRTKALLPVHLYGQPADLEPILAIAEKHGLQVIADAAQAHASTYKGKPIGSYCRASCFSFYPGKNLGAYGDAGAFVTDDEEIAVLGKSLIDHGRSEKYAHAVEGYNYRLDGLQAAVLRVKLGHLEHWTESRRRAAALYREKLASLPIEVAQESADRRHVYHLFSVFHDERDRLRDELAEKGIASGIHYPVPIHLQKAYEARNEKQGSYPVSERAMKRQMSLPMFPELTEEQIDHVVTTLTEALATGS